jgi:membrane protease YdiL (CAAX protease family)
MPLSPRTATALFLAIALGGSYVIGVVWAAHPAWGWITQFMMWTPGIAGLTVQALRREPPRTMSFGLGSCGWRPWAVAFLYPFAVIAACVVLAYCVRTVGGSGVIWFQPEHVNSYVFGTNRPGMAAVPVRLAYQLAVMLPWVLLASAYSYELPEKLGAGRHVARAILWILVFGFYPGSWWLPPGCIGEELGWRGWLVRTWRDRPLVALALSACAWALFHLPVVALEPQLHSFVAVAGFLLAVASAAAVFEALYLWSGSVWPPIVAHFTWNFWNPFFLGDQYGGGPSLFGGLLWLINGEGLLGVVVNGVITVVLVRHWRRRSNAHDRGSRAAA